MSGSLFFASSGFAQTVRLLGRKAFELSTGASLRRMPLRPLRISSNTWSSSRTRANASRDSSSDGIRPMARARVLRKLSPGGFAVVNLSESMEHQEAGNAPAVAPCPDRRTTGGVTRNTLCSCYGVTVAFRSSSSDRKSATLFM